MTRLLPALAVCLAVASLAPSASADHLPSMGGTVDCMYYYKATHVTGPYWVLQRDSCHAELYECPEGYAPPAPPCRPVEALSTDGATAAPAAAEPGLGWPTCAPIAVGNLCTSIYWPGCNVWIEWTAIPHPPTCLYSSDPLRMSALAPPSLEAPPIYCMPYERSFEAGPVTVIQGGCGNDARLCDESLLAVRGVQDVKEVLAACERALPPVYCSDIYARHEVGPAAVVMTSGCSGHVELCDTRVTDAVDARCVLAPIAQPAAAAEPMCLDYYQETEVGPVRHVQRDSCHSETYVCDRSLKEPLIATSPGPGDAGACLGDSLDGVTVTGAPDPLERRCWRQGQGELQTVTCVDPSDPDCLVYRQQITGVGSQWWCYPSGEHGSDF